jgi:hypothetical protein
MGENHEMASNTTANSKLKAPLIKELDSVEFSAKTTEQMKQENVKRRPEMPARFNE